MPPCDHEYWYLVNYQPALVADTVKVTVQCDYCSYMGAAMVNLDTAIAKLPLPIEWNTQ